MILMARAVSAVADRRIVGETSRLLAVEARVGDGLVDVESVIALPRVGSDVGDAEACIPALMLHRQVVLLGVRNAEVRVNGLWERDSRWPRDTGGREDPGQDHIRIFRGISEVWPLYYLGHPPP